MSGNSQSSGNNRLILEIGGITPIAAPTTSIAVCAWVKVNGWDKTGFDNYLGIFTPTEGVFFQQDTSGTGTADQASVSFYDGGVVGMTNENIIPLDTWTFVFIVVRGDQFTPPVSIDVYWGATTGTLNSETVVGTSLVPSAFNSIYVGSDWYDEASNASFRGVRVWTDLTWDLTQITAERNSADFSPVRTSNLISDIRIPNGTNPNVATNGANWTLEGTFTTDASNPVLSAPTPLSWLEWH